MHKKRITYIKAQLDVIAAMTHDNEGAHRKEDNLWEMVLNWIALGSDDSAELAALVLGTTGIAFDRWYT